MLSALHRPCRHKMGTDSDRAVRYVVAYSGLREKSRGSNPLYPFQGTAISGLLKSLYSLVLRRFQWLKRSSAGKPDKYL